MTLDELKKRATAAELTLIEAVTEALGPAIQNEVTERAIKFVSANLPPSREEMAYRRELGAQWASRFRAAMKSPTP